MKIGKKIIIMAVLVFIFLPVFAQAVSFWPLVPCGLSSQPKDSSGVELPKVPTQENPDAHDYTQPCNQCDLLRLFKNIIDFVLIGLMPPAAAILFVWGGFLILMGGANPGWITQGRSIFWNTAIGVAIISSSWLITNTIIRSIADDNVAPEWWKFECRVTTFAEQLPAPEPEPGPEQPPLPEPKPGQPPAPQPPGPQPEPGPVQPPVLANLVVTTSSLSDARQDFNYSQTIQVTGGKSPYNWSISGSSQLPSGLMINGSTGEIFGKPKKSGNFTFTVMVEDSSSPQKSITKQLSIKVVAPASSVVISNVASKNITNTSAIITWTTDKPATSQVAYGTTTAYGPPTSLNSNQVTNHSATITGLTPGTTYNYQAISSITGFTARSSNNKFKTTGQLPTPTPSPSKTPTPTPTKTPTPTGTVTPTLTPTPSGTATPTPISTPTPTPTSIVGDTCSLPQTLATEHNEAYPAKRSPELNTLLSCISNRLGQAIPSDGGVNSFYGSMYTLDQGSMLCNYTRADKHCDSSCAHTVNSCHYGGKTGNNGSLAVDFGNEKKGDIIIQAAVACGVPTSKARCENAAGRNVGCALGSGANHVHISAPTCDAN